MTGPETGHRKHGPLSTIAVFVAAFLAMLDLSISAVALPAIREDLNASLSGLQWMFDAYTLCFASLLLVGGLISDRLGHRTGLIASLGLFVVGSALCALAPSAGTLIAGRAVQGAAAAMLVPGSMAMIAQISRDDAHRARLIGIWSGLSGAAIALGPVVGGGLVEVLGWRSIFWINLPIGVAVIVLLATVVPAAARNPQGRIDVPGLLLGALWSAALAYAVIEGNVQGWTSPVIVGAFVVAVAALVAFLIVEFRLAHPMMPVRLFGQRAFAAANLISFAMGFALSSSFYFLSLLLQEVLGYGPLGAGLGFLPAAIALTVMAPLSGRLFARLGAGPLVAGGLLLGALGLFGLTIGGVDTPYLQYSWAVALIGVGWGAALPPTNAVALGAVPPQQAGAAAGTVETAMQFGTVVGIAVLGTVQATGLTSDLRDRLAGVGVAEPLRGQAADQIAAGQSQDLSGFTGDLERLTAQAFTHGLELVFVIGAVVVGLSALVALVGLPRRARPDAGGGEPSPVDPSAVSHDTENMGSPAP
ncbi:MFS transporter [Parafrankia sp. FMc2]|uniref:MFS transporter n=1 Tax=Parafrankia sp. FMc2 TaxID=3233196 RepID=UPI0034D53392